MIKRFLFIISCFVFTFNSAWSQLTVTGSNFMIYSGATVTVKGNISSNKNILGLGKLLLNGDDVQNLNMNGFSIPNLEIDNADTILLTGDARIGNSLLFTNGTIQAGDHSLTLGDIASVTGMGTGKFIETHGIGQVFKEISANVNSTEVPVGAGNIYRPAFITTSGSYSAAKVGVNLRDTLSSFAPPSISDYLKANWTISQTGIMGSLNVGVEYNSLDVVGHENNLKGYLYNGTDWSSTNETHDATINRIGFPVSGSSVNITAMDKFDLLKAKVFLQGAYNPEIGLMADKLRTPVNLIPLSDPYRSVPYDIAFTHLNNAITETASASVFSDQPLSNNDIVDWVFLELRNTVTPGNTVLQTRSALLQRDGDIVDVDGVSPVTFNNVVSGDYTIAVRHRNHLGLSTDPDTFTPVLDEKQSTTVLVDFSTSSNIFGPATAYYVATDSKHTLWGGNTNVNNIVRFSGPGNDKDYILNSILGGNSTTSIIGYSSGDINMDRTVKYSGPNNDKDFLLFSVLSSNVTNSQTQYLP
ncbi:MAG: hypothetical protein ABI325_05720 [Ginsengibacter sp.]